MKLHYMGKYSGDENDIPHNEHKPGAVMFREPDMKKLAILMNIAALVIAVILLIIVGAVYKSVTGGEESGGSMQLCLAAICAPLASFPHEIIHALCLKNDVYLFTNLKQGMLFVAGPEDMTKTRFVLMSLAPNIVFGFIPLILFFIFPKALFLGYFGAVSISCGAADYLNVINALTQMPKGSLTYLYGMHSYWYIPEK